MQIYAIRQQLPTLNFFEKIEKQWIVKYSYCFNKSVLQGCQNRKIFYKSWSGIFHKFLHKYVIVFDTKIYDRYFLWPFVQTTLRNNSCHCHDILRRKKTECGKVRFLWCVVAVACVSREHKLVWLTQYHAAEKEMYVCLTRYVSWVPVRRLSCHDCQIF